VEPMEYQRNDYQNVKTKNMNTMVTKDKITSIDSLDLHELDRIMSYKGYNGFYL
jgi:hypothetical protein